MKGDKKVIIIGATSGIGRALAEQFLEEGLHVGVTGRRIDLLKEIQGKYPGQVYIKARDINLIEEIDDSFQDLIDMMGGVDTIIISSGIGFLNPEANGEKELQTVQTNVVGFTGIVSTAYDYLKKRGSGSLVAITSIASIRGSGSSPSYSASKAFQSNYIRGIRYNTKKSGFPLHIMEVQPGFVDTKMAQGDDLFRVSSPQKAARQIIRARKKGKEHLYVSKRRRLVGWIMKFLPDFLWRKFS